MEEWEGVLLYKVSETSNDINQRAHEGEELGKGATVDTLNPLPPKFIPGFASESIVFPIFASTKSALLL